MQHLNVRVAPGESVSLTVEGKVYQNVSTHRLSRERAPCDRCPLCHGLIAGKDMAVLLSLCVVVVAMSAVCAACWVWSKKVDSGTIGWINPIATDTRLRIDQLYQRIARWINVDPIMIMALAITLFAPVLVLIVGDNRAQTHPRAFIQPLSVEADSGEVVSSYESIATNLGIRSNNDKACDESQCITPSGALRRCGAQLLAQSVDFADTSVDDLNRRFANVLPWDSSQVYGVCADVSVKCPFDELLTLCRAKRETTRCVFDSACAPEELASVQAFLTTHTLPLSYHTLASKLSTLSSQQ